MNTVKPGQIIVAHPDLGDGFFDSTVILITENHPRGTVGLAVNRTSELSMSTIAEEKGWSWPYSDALFQGGPVNRSALIMLHSADWFSSNTLSISDCVSLSSDHFMTEKMTMGNAPRRWRMCHGISGWFPGQLNAEIKQNKWLTGWPNEDILFKYSGEDQWRRAIDLCASQAVDAFF